MPIDEVGEGCLPAKGVYDSFLFDENGKVAKLLSEPIGWGQLEGDSTGQSKGQSFDSPNKSLEAPLARPSRAVLACTRKQISYLILLLCRRAWASEV